MSLTIIVLGLMFSGTLATHWQVQTTVSSGIKNAQAEQGVYIALYCEYGWSAPILLDDDAHNFQQGAVETFPFTSGYLGRLLKIHVWHDGNDGLHLQEIIVTNMDTKDKYVFNINRWIDTDVYDQQASMQMNVNFWPILDQINDASQATKDELEATKQQLAELKSQLLGEEFVG